MAWVLRITGSVALALVLAFFSQIVAPAHASAKALSLQRLCDDKSYNAFPDYRRHPELDVFHSYKDVYNAGAKKCFALLRTSAMSVSRSGEVSTSEELRDVSAGTSYGTMAVSGNVLQHTSHLEHCEINPPGRPHRTCRSEDEWNAFVAGYMRKR